MKTLDNPLSIQSYATDWLGREVEKPLAVYCPANEEEAANCIKLASKKKYKLKLRGGNTSLSGQTLVLNPNTVVIDTSYIKDCIKLEGDLLTISSGFTLFEANEFLKEYGRMIPLHMGSYQSACLGGIASTNAGGMHAWKYGMARNIITHVRGLLADGSIISEQSTSLKNNSLLGVADVLIGGEGKFGLITQLKIRTIPLHEVNKGVLISTSSFKQLNEIFYELEPKINHLIDICEFFVNPGFLSHDLEVGEFNILIGVPCYISDQDFIQELEAFFISKTDQSNNFGDSIFILDQKKYSKVLQLRENIPVLHKDMEDIIKFDISLDRNQIFMFYNFLINELHLDNFSFFGHYLDGNIHLNLSNNSATLKKIDSIYSYIINNDGSFSAEHGIGFSKYELYKKYKSSNSIRVMNAVKNALDPGNSFS